MKPNLENRIFTTFQLAGLATCYNPYQGLKLSFDARTNARILPDLATCYNPYQGLKFSERYLNPDIQSDRSAI